MFRKLTALAVAATAGLTTAGLVAGALSGTAAAATALPPRVVGHVYQASNDAAGNAVHVYNRLADGTLGGAGSVPTGGRGAGAALGSQGGLARDGRIVFVVNAGDDTVSALVSTADGLVLRDTVPSSGDFPVSVTVRGGVGYVLNRATTRSPGSATTGPGTCAPCPARPGR